MNDTEENEQMVAAEREEEPPKLIEKYPCPPIIWQGIYAKIREITKVDDWRMWIATTGALSARAHRNVHFDYYGDTYGMGYWLLAAPTGVGKGVIPRIARALLPADYHIETSIESGQGLPHLLLKEERDPLTDKFVSETSVPTLLLIAEWSLIPSMTGINNSTLSARMCEVYDGVPEVAIIRSDKNRKGQVRVPNPTLTILGTTTEEDLKNALTPILIKQGFINRHFILPGPRIKWEMEADIGNFDIRLIQHLGTMLPAATPFGYGRNFMTEVATEEAWQRVKTWGDEVLGAIYNDPQRVVFSQIIRRLHAYAIRIAVLYAWQARAKQVTIDHVEIGIAVAEVALAYAQELFADAGTATLPLHLKAQSELEEAILLKVSGEPGCNKKTLVNRLRRHGGFTVVSQTVDKLVQAGALEIKSDNKNNPQKLLYLTSACKS